MNEKNKNILKTQNLISMKTRLFIAAMILSSMNLLTSCTAEEMETEPQAVYELNANDNNEQTNIDPKK